MTVIFINADISEHTHVQNICDDYTIMTATADADHPTVSSTHLEARDDNTPQQHPHRNDDVKM